MRPAIRKYPLSVTGVIPDHATMDFPARRVIAVGATLRNRYNGSSMRVLFQFFRDTDGIKDANHRPFDYCDCGWVAICIPFSQTVKGRVEALLNEVAT